MAYRVDLPKEFIEDMFTKAIASADRAYNNSNNAMLKQIHDEIRTKLRNAKVALTEVK